jgi:hypothetical protein
LSEGLNGLLNAVLGTRAVRSILKDGVRAECDGAKRKKGTKRLQEVDLA